MRVIGTYSETGQPENFLANIMFKIDPPPKKYLGKVKGNVADYSGRAV
jgi:hypothetical protein